MRDTLLPVRAPVTRHKGWRPDTPDHRDYMRPVRAAVKLPASVDLRTTGFLPPVWDQGQLGSCTAHGIGAAFEFALKKEGKLDYSPSRLFIYYGERQIEGTISSDAGAEIRDGMKVLAHLGAPHEPLWPYDITQFKTQPSPSAYADGLRHEAIQYQRVAVDPLAVQQTLALGLPVVLGFSVYASFESAAVARTGMVPIPKKHEPLEGGHCVLLVGYQTLGATLYGIVRNSWGTGWGDRGYCYIPLLWLCNPQHADDFWTVETVK